MDVVKSFYSGYADAPTSHQDEITNKGKAYLDTNFPKLDSIKTATIVAPAGAPASARRRTRRLPPELAKPKAQPNRSSGRGEIAGYRRTYLAGLESENDTDAELLQPGNLKEQAPAEYDVKFVTTKGDFAIHVTRAWAPLGADRFYNLVKNGFYTDASFFRVLPGFVVQFGLSADPQGEPRVAHREFQGRSRNAEQ